MPGRICILSLTPIADDPRVRRQGEAFHRAGWQVTALGLPGAVSPAPAWEIREVATQPVSGATETADAQTVQPVRPLRQVLMHFLHHTAKRLRLREWLVRTQPRRHALYQKYPLLLRMAKLAVLAIAAVIMLVRIVDVVMMRLLAILSITAAVLSNAARHIASKEERMAQPQFARLRRYLSPMALFRDFANQYCLSQTALHAFYREGLNVDADIYLANDWYMLPVAIKLAETHGARFAYDTHEYALEEYRYKWKFRFTRRPVIYQIEKQAMLGACAVSTVSPGIARGLERDYRTGRTVHAIRNVPPRAETMPFRPTGERINVLYHGIISPDRGLEECIKSVPYWRPEFHFQLRGPFNSQQIEDTLRGLAHTYGVADRVHFLPKVSMMEMVRLANESDVGMSTPPKTSQHNIYALPNKLFEYIQAGLALAVCDLPDMAPIVTAHDCGVLIKGVTPEYIAQAINSLTRSKIDYYKQQSLKAAQVLNWETEAHLLTDLYERALTEKV